MRKRGALELYAIIETGGKQYKVQEGDIIFVEKLPEEDGSVCKFDKVLAVSDDNGFVYGNPTVEGASVEAKVIKNGKSAKIMVFKFKAKKNYRRRFGHRQPYTKVQIESIKA